MAEMIFRLVHDQARQCAMQACREAPEGYIVTIKEPTRSLEQNALIHAELTEIGRLLKWQFNGQHIDLDDLKTIFMAAYRKSTGQPTRFVMGVDQQPVILSWRTRELTRREGSEFVDMIKEWKANYIASLNPQEK